MAFGYGYHLCLGAELARSVANTVVRSVLEQTRLVTLGGQAPVLRPSPYLRTLTSLALKVQQ